MQTKTEHKGGLSPSRLKIEHGPSDAKLSAILRVWKNIKKRKDYSLLKNANVLDLASGSADSNHGWEPQFSRICSQNGARVVALDLHKQSDSEIFSWAEINLIEIVIQGKLKSLPILRGKRFDIINSSNFVGFNTPPGFNKQLGEFNITQSEFEQMLIEQLFPLLKKGGVISLDQRNQKYLHIMHKKVKGRLVTIGN